MTKKNVAKKVSTKKNEKQKVTQSVVAQALSATPELGQCHKSEADKIWDEIKNKPILMFALPNQFVFQHCNQVPVEPSKLYLTIRSTATLPSLETAIGNKFSVELADKFVIVSRVK